MALLIKTTGLEQYAPGGQARVKVLNVGGPGVGKTRFASYFPDPIYADCEKGLASVADRNVPYVDIASSRDMLDLLAFLKQECMQPESQRQYRTIVVDTLDAFQRRLKNEWMETNKKPSFTGWEAWGFLNQNMQLLLTRLLGLDMNVVVNVHYKDKTVKDAATDTETREMMLQLQGESADTAFNDFDLVGYMGTYWESDGEKRVQKRGLTFTATPDKPFLKDRLFAAPKWLEVKFDPTDYTGLFDRIAERVAELKTGQTIGEVPSESPTAPKIAANVIAPGAAGGGAMPTQTERKIPISQLDKPTLVKRARDLGLTIDGAPIKGNTTKGELIKALEDHEAQQEKEAKGGRTTATAATGTLPAPADPAPEPQRAGETPVPAAPAGPARSTGAPARAVPPPAEPVEPAKLPPRTPSQDEVEPSEGDKAIAQLHGMKINKQTGEILEAEEVTPQSEPEQNEGDQAIQTIKDSLGGEVIEDHVEQAPPAPVASPAKAAEVVVCAECGKDLTDEDPDIFKLSWIRFRKRLCKEHYTAAKPR